jgi:YqfQ-like protein
MRNKFGEEAVTMQPRQRIPLQGRMGPYMIGPSPYGGQGPMMNPFGGGQMMGSPRPFQGGRQMMGRGQGRRSGGGLLARILGGKNQGMRTGGLGIMQHAGRTASSGGGGLGSILQTLSKPEGLSGILNNTQQVIKTAQTIGPMIQQYGPIVKNLPMMWKLYKGFKDLPSGETTEEATSESVSETEMEETPVKVETSVMDDETDPKKAVKKKHTKSEETVAKKPQKHRGNSLPKLYI